MNSAPNSIRPAYPQFPFVDQQGKLSEQAWWFLHDLTAGAQSAANNSVIDAVPLEPVDGVVTPDLSQSGPFGSFSLVLSGVPVTIEDPVNGNNPVLPGSRITIIVDQDSTGGRPAPIFSTGGTDGFSADFNDVAIVETANTRTIYVAGYDGTEWSLISFDTGLTI